MKYPGFIGGSAQSQSPLASAERTVNWYVEALPNTAKNQAALYPTPGQVSFLSTTDVGTRGLFTMNARTHGVIGTNVYELFATATATLRGTVTQDNNPAQMTTNGVTGNALCLSSGGNVYYINLTTNVLSQVSGVAALQVGMLDGYFIAFDPIAGKIRLSPLNDSAGVWDATQYAQRSAAPDPWKAMLVDAPNIWLVGEQTTDVWYDAGTSPFPLAPRSGLSFKYGTEAPFSLAAASGSVLWLSRNAEGAGIVVQTQGLVPQRISTATVETAIAGYQRTASITDAEALVYQAEGHTFYVLKFPSANATWAYDLTTRLWAERGTWNAAMNRYDAWHPRVHTYAFGSHLVGESGTGTISKMDVTYGSEADGSAIRRLRVAPGIFNEHRQVPIRRLEVYLETGLGTSTGQGSDPMVMWRTSNDGGHTWGRERQVSAGKIGEYKRRVVLTRMGRPRDRVNEMTVSDPIPWRVIDAYINNDVAGQSAA